MNIEWRTRLLPALAAALLGSVAGCGSSIIPSLTGGGLPPGELDIGGIVVTESAATLTGDGVSAQTPVAGASVKLMRGSHQVGSAVTGASGYFSFGTPPTGDYRVEVTPPPGSGLMGAQRSFRHQRGKQTFLTIVLDEEAAGRRGG